MVTFDLYPRLARHIFAALLGVGAAVGGFFSGPIACLVAVGMLGALCYRHSLVLDLETRTYRVQRRFSRRTGTFGDLKGIEVQLNVVVHQSGVSEFFVVSLLWVNGKQNPWELITRRTHAEAMEDARRLQDRLGLPIIESGTRTVRSMTRNRSR